MIKLMVDGGPGMWALLLLGLVGLWTAGWFAWRAEARVRGFLDSLARSLAFAMLALLAMDVMATLFFVSHAPPEQKGAAVVQGLGESMAPVLLGSAFLCLIHLLTAIGQRRLDARTG
jgi:hypothetical protein